jgi:hypothetical protein
MSGLTKGSGKSDRDGRERTTQSVLRYYRCQSAQGRRDLTNHCKAGHYNADDLEHLVIAALTEIAKQPESLRSAIAEWEAARLRTIDSEERDRAEAPETVRMEAQMTRLREQYATLEKREQATIEAQIAGVMAGADPRFYADSLARVSSERQEVASAIEDMEERMRTGDRSLLHVARRSVLETAIALRATATHAVGALPTLIETYLNDDSVPVARRHGTLSKIIDRIVPEGEGKPLHVTGARIYLVDPLLSLVPARPAALENGALARPDSSLRFLLKGARMTVRATFTGKRVPGASIGVGLSFDVVDDQEGGCRREAA